MGIAKEYSLVPRAVPCVETPFRRIVTDLPVPESLPILERLHAYEPVAMRGQPPVVWDRAEGFQVYDAWGNQWIDWSSGVLIANAGHGRAGDRRRHRARRPPRACSPITASPARSARGWWRSWPPAARAAEEGLPADHRLGNRGVRHQAVPHARRQIRRTREERDRLLRQGLPRPHAGRRSRPAAFPR